MTEPRTATGKRLFAHSDQIAERRLAADPTEDWVADAWAADNQERIDILAIEAEAAVMERERLRAVLLGAHKTHDTGHYTLAYCPLCATAYHLLADPEATE